MRRLETHDTLLAYLVRRLLENGANTSFVNRIADPAVPIEALIADPVDLARAIPRLGSPHPKIALPADLFGDERVNSSGVDLSNEDRQHDLGLQLKDSKRQLAEMFPKAAGARAVCNPADRRDIVGWLRDPTEESIKHALADAQLAAPNWAAVAPIDRAARPATCCIAD